MLDNAKKQGDITNEIKAAALLCKINDQLLQMLMLLPTVRCPPYDSDSTSKVPLQQQLSEATKPIFDDDNDPILDETDDP